MKKAIFPLLLTTLFAGQISFADARFTSALKACLRDSELNADDDDGNLTCNSDLIARALYEQMGKFSETTDTPLDDHGDPGGYAKKRSVGGVSCFKQYWDARSNPLQQFWCRVATDLPTGMPGSVVGAMKECMAQARVEVEAEDGANVRTVNLVCEGTAAKRLFWAGKKRLDAVSDFHTDRKENSEGTLQETIFFSRADHTSQCDKDIADRQGNAREGVECYLLVDLGDTLLSNFE